MQTMRYVVEPPVGNGALNQLFAAAWPNARPQDVTSIHQGIYSDSPS